jgi:hypothetical protein
LEWVPRAQHPVPITARHPRLAALPTLSQAAVYSAI